MSTRRERRLGERMGLVPDSTRPIPSGVVRIAPEDHVRASLRERGYLPIDTSPVCAIGLAWRAGALVIVQFHSPTQQSEIAITPRQAMRLCARILAALQRSGDLG